MAGSDGLVKATGASPKRSLEADTDARDTTSLLGHDDADEKRFQQSIAPRGPEASPRKRRSWATVAGAGLAVLGVVAGAGLYLFRHEAEYGQSPPWYPTPRGGTHESWQASYEKARVMVNKMSLLEKVNVTTGVGWASGFCLGNTAPAVEAGFPGLCLQDGPLGLRHLDHITVFPAGITVGATFNKELMYQRGKAYGREARLKGVNAILGPSMGALGRIPAGGRNWEGFGSDPVLQGVASYHTIRGIQEEGVMATAKHFVGNEQEHFRQPFEWGLPQALSANIDDRTLHEVYAWPFADSVRAGVASIMCSYNMVNNSYACANSKLMNGILKDELGFQGFVQSDWLAQRGGVSAALAGLDVTMPGDGLHWADANSLWGGRLTAAVLNGSVPAERLDDMAARVVAAWYQLGQDDKAKFPDEGPNFSSWTDEEVGPIHFSSGENATGVVNQFKDVRGTGKDFSGRLVKAVGAEGTVLVKNDGGVLPLAREGWTGGKTTRSEGRRFRVGIFGTDAGPGRGPNACPDRACNDGTLAIGWGSGTADFTYLVTPEAALGSAFLAADVRLESYLTNTPDVRKNASMTADQDLCIAFINANGGEGFASVDGAKGDRNDLWPQRGGDWLVQQVAATCGGPTVVVVHSVGPVLVERWIDLAGVKAVLFAHLPGQESGHALTDVLFGWKDASGRLPYTVGRSLDDYGPGAQLLYWPNAAVPQQDFAEGLLLDYRHFDRAGVAPRFEFGFGLSYTTFRYSDLHVATLKPRSALPDPRPPGPAPPQYASGPLPAPEDAVFPPGFRRVPKRVYPYLRSAADVRNGSYPYPDGYGAAQPPSPAGGGPGGNPSLWDEHVAVAVTVRNTGDRRGKEVVQLYVSFPDGVTDEDGSPVDFPVRVLRGFEKVEVGKGKSARVEMRLTRRDLSYWSALRQNWVMPEGKFVLAVGRSSRRIEVQGEW